MRAVWLGEGADGPIQLSKEAGDVHLHVIGLSRQGKSYFLEHLIRQDIARGNGVCVIDPHGEMYDHLVDWCAANEMHKRRRIHLINPANGDWSVGFNPLCVGDEFADARVRAMIAACQKVWDDTESTGHKTLARLLEMVFDTLAFHRLSLHEASLLTSLKHRNLRKTLVDETQDPQLIDDWDALDQLKPSEFVMRFEAVNNRLRALVRSRGVAEMVSQTEDVIDFRTCMDNGHIVLVNLAHKGKIPPNVADTVGALITADLFHAAQCRSIDYAKERPFYCYIDECGDYLNETIVKGLDQTAKFGLHYVLSHQRLSQLGQSKEDPIRNGVMGGAQSKVVFLQEDSDTTNELGHFLFAKSFDLERPKEVLIKPAVVGYSREWLSAEGEAAGQFAAESEGTISASNMGISLAEYDGATPINIEGESAGQSYGTSLGRSSVQSRSQHEALIPVLEDLPGGVYSLEELKHQASVEIRLLQKRQAIAYCADDRRPQQFVTADIFPARPTPDQIVDFFDCIGEREPSAKSVATVSEEIRRRRHELTRENGAPDLSSTDDFFED